MQYSAEEFTICNADRVKADIRSYCVCELDRAEINNASIIAHLAVWCTVSPFHYAALV